MGKGHQVRPQFCQLSHRFVSLLELPCHLATSSRHDREFELLSRSKISKCYHSIITVQLQLFFKITFCGKSELKKIFVCPHIKSYWRGKNHRVPESNQRLQDSSYSSIKTGALSTVAQHNYMIIQGLIKLVAMEILHQAV